jgi:hypothetical protein
MDTIQIFSTVAACADPQVYLTVENYELMRSWLDFMFGKIGYTEINNIVTAWVAKNNPNVDLVAVSDSLKTCADSLLGRRGA